MNRSDIAKMVANSRGAHLRAATRPDLSVAEAEQLVTSVIVAFLETVTLTLQCDEPVILYGFGRFERRHLDAYTMTNPASGAQVAIPERATVSFNPSRALKDRLNFDADAIASEPAGVGDR
jgi:nucleoid DNA-binding protein